MVGSMAWVAPSCSARSRFVAFRSTAMTGMQPLARAAMIAQRPMPPAPNTTRLAPGSARAVLNTAPMPVGSGAAEQHRFRRSRPGGSGVRRFSLITAWR